MSPEVWTIVVAAGSGRRFGGPKQFERLGPSTVLDRSVATARQVSRGVVVVVPSGSGVRAADLGVTSVVDGGATRSDSVRAGLAAVPASATVIAVHDAARPLATESLYRALIATVDSGASVAVPAVDVADSLRRRGDGVVDRTDLVAVQTPQVFAAAALRLAHAAGVDASDDATLAEAVGHEVVIVDGEPSNFKITTADDLAVAEALVSRREVAS